MFGMSMTELVIIAILALVLLGPDRLPEAAKTIGKTVRDLKKQTDGLKDQLEAELYKAEKSMEKALQAPEVPPVAQAAIAASGRPASTAPAPAATAQNVPGLEAALVDAAPPPAPPPDRPA